MAKITQEIASLYHFIKGLRLDIKKYYFGEIPEGFAVPAVYFPTPETINRGFSVSGFEREAVCYLKVFDNTSMDSDMTAQLIIEAIMQAGRNIPLYNAEGKKTDIAFHIYTVNSRNLETGVTQIEISYKTHTAYVSQNEEKASIFHYVGLPTDEEP